MPLFVNTAKNHQIIGQVFLESSIDYSSIGLEFNKNPHFIIENNPLTLTFLKDKLYNDLLDYRIKKENKNFTQENKVSKLKEIKNNIDFDFYDNNDNLLSKLPNINGIQTIFFKIIEKKKFPNIIKTGRGISPKKFRKFKKFKKSKKKNKRK